MRGRILRVILIPLLASSCVTIRGPAQAPGTSETTKPGGEGARADETAAYEAALREIDVAHPDRGRAALEAFVARYPRSVERSLAEAHIADLALTSGDLRGARAALDRGKAGAESNRFVAFMQGIVAARSGDPKRAVSLLTPFSGDGPPRDVADRDQAELSLYAALGDARLGTGDAAGALAAWETYSDRRARDPEKAFARERADEIAARLTDDEAVRLYGSTRSDFLHAALGGRAAAALHARGDAGGAGRIDEETASLRRNLGFIAAARGASPGDPFRLGLLAPFSGSAALLGEVALRGAMLAIGDTQRDPAHPFQIVARDAAPDRPAGGERAAGEVIREEAAVAVVGVGDKGAAASAAREGVPVLLLDEAPPASGTSAFQILHPLDVRATELARRALVLGARRFAVLAPDSPSGRRLSEAFVRAVTAGGGRVTAQANYPAGTNTFSAAVGRIKKAQFEAIFVGDDAGRLELIAPALAAADIWPAPYGAPVPPAAPGAPAPHSVLLLSPAVGLGPQLLRNAGRYVQGALLAPGFFADSDDPRTSPFVNQFRTLYGQDPGAVDAYGYDAFRMLVSAVGRGARNRPDVLRVIASEPFEGVTGTVKFGPDHTRVDPPPIYVVAGDAIRAFR